MNLYRLRYYLKKFAGFLGFCYRCRTTLNYTRSRVGICPKCGLRH
jgi:predicted amidophosphoribosyltransferase